MCSFQGLTMLISDTLTNSLLHLTLSLVVDNDNDKDKVLYSTLITHFTFNTVIDAFAF